MLALEYSRVVQCVVVWQFNNDRDKPVTSIYPSPTAFYPFDGHSSSPEALVHIYQTAWYHVTKAHVLNIHASEKLKYYKVKLKQ